MPILDGRDARRSGRRCRPRRPLSPRGAGRAGAAGGRLEVGRTSSPHGKRSPSSLRLRERRDVVAWKHRCWRRPGGRRARRRSRGARGLARRPNARLRGRREAFATGRSCSGRPEAVHVRPSRSGAVAVRVGRGRPIVVPAGSAGRSGSEAEAGAVRAGWVGGRGSSGRARVGCGGAGWLRGQDLNLRPSGYAPDELPGCSTPRRPPHVVCDVVGPRVTTPSGLRPAGDPG